MLTLAMLAIIGAFTFGFVLCGMFAVGAAADRSDHPELHDGRDSLEGALLRAALDAESVRHPDTYPPVSSDPADDSPCITGSELVVDGGALAL